MTVRGDRETGRTTSTGQCESSATTSTTWTAMAMATVASSGSARAARRENRGGAMVTKRRASQARVQKMAEAAAARSTDTTRHRCFVSYHVDDEAEVTQFLNAFGDQIIA